MKRLLAILALWAIVAVPSGAALTGAWTNERGDANRGLAQDRCVRFSFADTSVESQYLYVGGYNVSILFEPDDLGADTTATADVYVCTETDPADDGASDDDGQCRLFLWDSDGDGALDASRLTHATDGTKGLSHIQMAGYLYIDPVGAPGGSGDAVVQVCASPVDRR